MKWLLYFHEKVIDEMNKIQVILFLIFHCCLSNNNTYAQKASFINGNFIVAFYSEHDKQVKFVNTYTTQAFAWFHYTGAEPKMWFVGSQLIVVNEKEAIVSGLESNNIKKYTLTGKPIQNTMWQWSENDSVIIITSIITEKQTAKLIKESNKKIIELVISSDEKKMLITSSQEAKQLLSFYTIAETPVLIWQNEISSKENLVLSLNSTGNLIAMWDGSVTTLLSTTDGSIVQTIGNQYQVLRFTAKDELICINLANPKAALFTKPKSNLFKIKGVATFKSGLFVHPNGKESILEWNIQYISDDLTMAIGFGDKVVGLYKNGPTFLFF
jgi:hypothetical protein